MRSIALFLLIGVLLLTNSCTLPPGGEHVDTVIFSLKEAKTGYLYVLLDEEVKAPKKKDGVHLKLEFSDKGAIWVHTFEILHRKFLKVISADGTEHRIRHAGANGCAIRYFIAKSDKEFAMFDSPKYPRFGDILEELETLKVPFIKVPLPSNRVGVTIKKP